MAVAGWGDPVMLMDPPLKLSRQFRRASEDID